MTFKKGDLIERIVGDYNNMFIGDKDTIVEYGDGSMTLKKNGEGHDPNSFKKIPHTLKSFLQSKVGQ